MECLFRGVRVYRFSHYKPCSTSYYKNAYLSGELRLTQISVRAPPLHETVTGNPCAEARAALISAAV